MTNSRVLRNLNNGGIALTMAVSRVTEPWFAEAVGRVGYDAIWYDLEHRPFADDTVERLSLACRATGIDLMVRIRKTGYQEPMQALENGANGIMVPHCLSAAEAKQWVDWVKFPPVGKRGMDGSGPDADYGMGSALDYLKHANKETFLALQIEDREAVEQIDEIATVPGFDILFVGPGDLSISYGVPMETDHPKVQQAIDRVAAAAARHGKWWGLPTGTPEAAQKALDRGARMVTGGSDHWFLVRGLQESFEKFKKVAPR